MPTPRTTTCAGPTTTAEKEDTPCSPTPPSRDSGPSGSRPWPGLQEQREHPDYAALSFEERLGLLVDRELTERQNRRLQRP